MKRDVSNPEANAALAALSGPAPPGEIATLEQAARLAPHHPFDAALLLRLGELLAEAGQRQPAVTVLERAVWIADLDPQAARAAVVRLRELSPRWQGRRAIPVHVWADESMRASPGWRFRLRNQWRSVSNSFSDLVGVRFVLQSIGDFSTLGISDDLDSIHQHLRQSIAAPQAGILVGFTARPAPPGAGVRKRGLADFAGRWASVRFEPEGVGGRTLAHELLHLFGAIHLSDNVESIMNPSGEATTLDPYNLQIVRALSARAFGAGGFDRNVLDHVDLEATIAAFSAALAANLTFRRLGLSDALEVQEQSRYQAARAAERAQSLDPHLADVSRTLARLQFEAGHRVAAVRLLDAAALLYGPDTPRGRRTAERAEVLRRQLVDAYGR